ncbi:hypothetical protein Bca52824_013735 [Brassica carinata]|uniref:VWFA domain-containing protein n=1 Tax=Brassica carinata TaxID=52824 RepID=A0A8X7W070_BRACI|nr:hypothetical protein Bca52824_013735 [Brassica carinata]
MKRQEVQHHKKIWNVGDALKEWKERIKVSSDLGEKQEAENEMEDPDAGEYGYASQFDEGTSQALGPALPEQVNTNMREGESEDEKLAGNQDEASPMDIDEEDRDARSNAVILWRRCLLRNRLRSWLSSCVLSWNPHLLANSVVITERPNKRDYQVVIAVDDSRSMSESGCGYFAIRALETLCREMSQLEMTSLAVESFGKKGSIKMLHDFGESFTTESGIKMISGLTFKQENLIEDEPIFNLLRNMNEILENLASTRRQSVGSNPLQQLVLIIGDGKFHEREKLKRSVRKFLQLKRMVVYLLLDNAEQSVLDLKVCPYLWLKY